MTLLYGISHPSCFTASLLFCALPLCTIASPLFLLLSLHSFFVLIVLIVSSFVTTYQDKVNEHKIVVNNNIGEVKKAIKNKDSIYIQDDYDQNMLHVACYEGRLEIVTMLLNKYKEEDLSLRDKVALPSLLNSLKTTL